MIGLNDSEEQNRLAVECFPDRRRSQGGPVNLPGLKEGMIADISIVIYNNIELDTDYIGSTMRMRKKRARGMSCHNK